MVGNYLSNVRHDEQFGLGDIVFKGVYTEDLDRSQSNKKVNPAKYGHQMNLCLRI